MSLYDTLQAIQNGSQMGNAASQGMVPNSSQPMGSPQLSIAAVNKLRGIIKQLNEVMDEMFRNGSTDDEMHKAVQEVMSCTQKLQGVANGLQDHAKELQGASMMGSPGAAPMQAPTQQQAVY